MTERRYNPRFTPRERAYVRALVLRIVRPSLAVLAVFLGGTFGFYFLGRGRWSLLETAYFTTISMTTVGYGDTLGIEADPHLKIFNMALLWVGLLVTLYAVSTITAFLVEEHLGNFFKERKMLSKIDALEGHYIVCGSGSTGEHVIDELYRTRRPFVVVELAASRIEHMRLRYEDLPVVEGDATDEKVLELAGIQRAAGVVCCLHDDSRNMLLTVLCSTAGNKNLRIVSKCTEHERVDAFRRAGATAVVSPNFIGGLRMASEIARPHVTGFFDRMLRQTAVTRMEEVTVSRESHLAGKSLAHSGIQEKTGLQVVAVSSDGGTSYEFNPQGSRVLAPGDVCIVIGEMEKIEKLRQLAA